MNALQIASAVRARRISAETIVNQTLDHIAASDGVLNAFTAITADEALADARRLDAAIAGGRPAGPLAGVPFAVKNLFDIRGMTTLAGSKIRRGASPATADAALITRLKSAGALLVGALNMDEFAYGFVTENAHYGATRNPHDVSRIAGGSSGGSAAAVAARLVPLALGTDTNGSIRVPASLCGVYGLKPTAGRLSLDGVFPFAASLDHAGVFATTLADIVAAYGVLQSEGTGSADRRSMREKTSLRVGVLGGWFVRGAAPEVLECLTRAGNALGAQGGVELAGAEAARSAAFCLTAGEGALLHRNHLQGRLEDFDPAVRDRLLAGALLPERVLEQAKHFQAVFRGTVSRLFERYDVLLAPATACHAPRIGQATMAIDGVDVSTRKNLGAYTQPLSFVGLPVLAAPVNRPGSLPIGIQIIAAPQCEELIFNAAAQLENQGFLGSQAPRGYA